MAIIDNLPKVSRSGWPWSQEVNPEIYSAATNWPKISIVTPSFNQGGYIEETIRSILLQNYPNLEYIIIDGGSSDETVEIIKKYSKWISFWVSETDAGQSDAINKGLNKSSGVLFNWINSDDYLKPQALYQVGVLAKEESLLAFSVDNFDEGTGSFTTEVNQHLTFNEIVVVNAISKLRYHQPGVWFPLEKLKTLGEFNTRLRYYFDLEHTFKYLFKFKEVIYIESSIVVFRLHSHSKTIGESASFVKEKKKAYENFYHWLPSGMSKFLVYRKFRFIEFLEAMAEHRNKGTNMRQFIVSTLVKNPLGLCTRAGLGFLKKLIKRSDHTFD